MSRPSGETAIKRDVKDKFEIQVNRIQRRQVREAVDRFPVVRFDRFDKRDDLRDDPLIQNAARSPDKERQLLSETNMRRKLHFSVLLGTERTKATNFRGGKARSILVLDPVDETLGAVLEIGGVGFIGVDVHGEREPRIDPNPDIAEEQFTITGNAHAHRGLVAQSIAQGVGGRHVDVTERADHSFA